MMKSFYILCVLIVLTSCGIQKNLNNRPELSNYQSKDYVRNQINDSLFYIKDNFIKKNKTQNWELYVSGDALEIGQKTGILTKELYEFQEHSFIELINKFVPNERKQKFLFKFLKYYNRELYKYVLDEHKVQIYGLSQSSTDRYDSMLDKYNRNLFLHGAHDIGHAIQDLMLVGCSSLAVWNENSEDGQLLIGRNFDFYANDDFAKNKIVSFIQPKSGHPYMSVSWAGMIGVVSGMNAEGLTVTINAGKSSIPLKGKTPISLVALEILQYASTIEEAVAIARDKKVFVSESIMVSSAKDRNVVLIEIAPKNFGVYQVDNQSHLACTNHFQSGAFAKDKRNIQQKLESHSAYRYDKLQENIQENKTLNPKQMIALLRDTSGLKNAKIGYGNEKSLNQLLAHHSIIFQPEKRLVWVSSNPYQLGEFTAYDLNHIFKDSIVDYQLNVENLEVAKDEFLETEEYKLYEEYRKLTIKIDQVIRNKTKVSDEILAQYISTNPDFWVVYAKVGDYYYQHKQFDEATHYYEVALTKEITTIPDRNKIHKKLKKCSQ